MAKFFLVLAATLVAIELVKTQGTKKQDIKTQSVSRSISNHSKSLLLQGEDCSCSGFIDRNGIGKCMKTPECYVNLPSTCKDLKQSSTNPDKYISVKACKYGKMCECNGATTTTTTLQWGYDSNDEEYGRYEIEKTVGECKESYDGTPKRYNFCFVDQTSVCPDRKRTSEEHNPHNEEDKKFYSILACKHLSFYRSQRKITNTEKAVGIIGTLLGIIGTLLGCCCCCGLLWCLKFICTAD